MTKEEFLKKIGGDESSIRVIVNRNVAIKAVKQDGDALRYVKDQSETVCLEAVKQDGDALRYVKDQSETVCLEAVKQNGYALRYVKDQSETVCLEAVKQNGHALRYVDVRIFDDTTDVELARDFRRIKELYASTGTRHTELCELLDKHNLVLYNPNPNK